MNTQNQNDVRELLKGLSGGEFLRMGMHEIAYIRALPGKADHDALYGIYAADGTRLSVMESVDTALAAIRHNDLVPVTLH